MSEFENLPKGWAIAKLGELVITEKGKKPKRISKDKTKECSIPYVNIKAFEKNIIDEYTDGLGCVLCEDDDFLMVWDGSRSGYVGKAIKGALGSTLVRIKLPLMNQDYVYYFLQSKFIEINTRAKGVGIPHVDPNLLWNYDFHISPLPEQTRILAKLEQLLTDLDKGIEYLETTKQQLKVYRHAVLKWAFEGKLTNKDVKDGELPNGWKTEILKNICIYISDGDHLPPPKSKSGIPFITISDIDNNKIDFSNTMFMTEQYYENLKENRKPFKGDILYTVTGSYGIPVLINFEKKFCFQRHIGLIRPKEYVNQKWLFYLLQSPQILSQANKTATGTAQKTVALSALRQFNIPYCEPKEQEKLVQQIESRLSVCDKIEETIESSLQQAEALRLSIIKKAFEGKLVPQDPNDEPAEKLLQQLRIENYELRKKKK